MKITFDVLSINENRRRALVLLMNTYASREYGGKMFM